jgi:hypothetical protein
MSSMKELGEDEISSVSNDVPQVKIRPLSATINSDEPKPDLSTVKQKSSLAQKLAIIDSKLLPNGRVPLRASSHKNSVRVIPLSVAKSQTSANSRRDLSFIRGNLPDKNLSPEERVYKIRTEFNILAASNPKVRLPPDGINDPDVLERMYLDAVRECSYTSVSTTWLLYMGVGYSVFHWICDKLGFSLPPEFVKIQIDVMSHYHYILKSLGDPGGPSITSTWSPWAKLICVILLHTVIFIFIYKLTGNSAGAYTVQKVLAGTNMFGGSPNAATAEATVASEGLGGLISAISGNTQGGGIGGIISGVMKLLGGGGGGGNPQSGVDDIDLDNIPEPEGDKLNSARKNDFDE